MGAVQNKQACYLGYVCGFSLSLTLCRCCNMYYSLARLGSEKQAKKKKPPLCIALCMAHRATTSRSPAYISNAVDDDDGEQTRKNKKKKTQEREALLSHALKAHTHTYEYVPPALKVNELCSSSRSSSRSKGATSNANKLLARQRHSKAPDVTRSFHQPVPS